MTFSMLKKSLATPWAALAMIALGVFILYSNIYDSPFVFDDKNWIVENPNIRNLHYYFSFENLRMSRAIVYATFAINYSFGSLNVFGYHLVNILIHMINGFIVYFLSLIIFTQTASLPTKETACRSSSIPWMALLAALIFVAHPIQTQAVNYTVQRLTSMAAMFYLASVLFYMKGRVLQRKGAGENQGEKRKNNPGLYFWIFALYGMTVFSGVLALFSKQNTVSLPLAILLVEYLFFDRTWAGWRRKLVWFVPCFLLFGFFVLHLSGFFRGEVYFGRLLEDVSDLLRDPGSGSRWNYLCTQFNVIVIYVRLLFLPVGQSLDYMYPFKSSFFAGWTPLAFFFLVCIASTGVWNIKKRPIVAFGIFWFFITLSVESSFIPIKDALFEHRLYLPSFGFAIVVPFIIFHFLSGKPKWAISISLVIVILLGTTTYLRNTVWESKVSIWADTVSENPKNFSAHVNLGIALYKEGRREKAISHFLRSLELQPAHANAHYNLAIALENKGETIKAIDHYKKCLQITSNDWDARYKLATVLMRTNNVDEAIRQHATVVGRKRQFREGKGPFEVALNNYCTKMKIFVKPGDLNENYDLAMALAYRGDLKEAVLHYSEVLKINPDHAEAHNNLGVVLARLGNMEEAAGHFSEALRIKPGYEDARRNLKRCTRLLSKKKRYK